MPNQPGIVAVVTTSMTKFAFVLCCYSLLTTLLLAETFDAPETEAINVADAATPFRQLPMLDYLAVHNGMAYVCWPEQLVGQTTLTAIDLATVTVKWTRTFVAQSMRECLSFGEFLFCETNDLDVTTEWVVRADSGAIVTQHAMANDDSTEWFEMRLISEHYLVTGRIYEISSGQLVGKLDFVCAHAIVDGDKLYTVELREVGSSHDHSMDQEQVLRRTDLKTGLTELAVTLQSNAAIKEVGSSFTLIAAKGDRVILRVNRKKSEKGKDSPRVVFFDMARETVLMVSSLPCEIRSAKFREKGLLECQCRGRTVYGLSAYETLERQPLLVDLETGRYQADPEWLDPYSMIAWHSGPMSIIHVRSVNRYLLAILDLRAKPNRDIVVNRMNAQIPVSVFNRASVFERGMLCMDSTSGQLLWFNEVADLQPLLVDLLTEKSVRAIAGGIQITDVETGAEQMIKAENVGLKLVPEMHLPRRLAANSIAPIPAAQYDSFYDRLLLGLPGLPLILWGIYQLLRWQRVRSSKSNVVS